MLWLFYSTCYVQDGKFAVCWLNDVRSVLEIMCPETGRVLHTIPLPEDGLGKVALGIDKDPESTKLFFTFTSPTNPGSTFRCRYSPVHVDRCSRAQLGIYRGMCEAFCLSIPMLSLRMHTPCLSQ